MKIMYRPEQIEQDMNVMTKARDKANIEQKPIELTSDVTVALGTAYMVYQELSKIGREGLDKAGEIIKIPYVSSRTISRTVRPISDGEREIGSVDPDLVKCALTALNVYKTLIPWQEQVNDFRKLKCLEAIL